MPPIDADQLRLRRGLQVRRAIAPPRPQNGEAFLKGPIPLAWLERAARLPGKSLQAAVALWYAAGLLRSARIPLSNVSGHRFGLDRNAKYRALAWLERAGLVTVERTLGRSPVVTIQHTPVKPHESPADASTGG